MTTHETVADKFAGLIHSMRKQAEGRESQHGARWTEGWRAATNFAEERLRRIERSLAGVVPIAIVRDFGDFEWQSEHPLGRNGFAKCLPKGLRLYTHSPAVAPAQTLDSPYFSPVAWFDPFNAHVYMDREQAQAALDGGNNVIPVESIGKASPTAAAGVGLPGRRVVFPHPLESEEKVEKQRIYADGWNACHDAFIAYGDAREAAAVARVPSYEALEIIALSVAGALERAGVTDCDDPGEAIDVLRERWERAVAPAACSACDNEGVFASDGTGPYDCYRCGKKADPVLPATSVKDSLTPGGGTCSRQCSETMQRDNSCAPTSNTDDGESAALASRPAVGGASAQWVGEIAPWSDAECVEFACVAFRHSKKNLPVNVTLNDIRLGAQRVLSARITGGRSDGPPICCDGVCNGNCDGDPELQRHAEIFRLRERLRARAAASRDPIELAREIHGATSQSETGAIGDG